MEFLDLHDDIIIEVLSLLDLVSIIDTSQSCRRLRHLTQDNFAVRESSVFEHIINHIYRKLHGRKRPRMVYDEIHQNVLRSFQEIILLLRHFLHVTEITAALRAKGAMPHGITKLLEKAEFARRGDENALVFKVDDDTTVSAKLMSPIKDGSYWAECALHSPCILSLQRKNSRVDLRYHSDDVTSTCDCQGSFCWTCIRRKTLLTDVKDVCGELKRMFAQQDDEDFTITPLLLYTLSKYTFDDQMNFQCSDISIDDVIKKNNDVNTAASLITRLREDYARCDKKPSLKSMSRVLRVYSHQGASLERRRKFVHGLIMSMQPISRAYTCIYHTDVYMTRYLHFALQQWKRVDLTSIQVEKPMLKGSFTMQCFGDKRVTLTYDKIANSDMLAELTTHDGVKSEISDEDARQLLIDGYIRRNGYKSPDNFKNMNELFVGFFFEDLAF